MLRHLYNNLSNELQAVRKHRGTEPHSLLHQKRWMEAFQGAGTCAQGGEYRSWALALCCDNPKVRCSKPRRTILLRQPPCSNCALPFAPLQRSALDIGPNAHHDMLALSAFGDTTLQASYRDLSYAADCRDPTGTDSSEDDQSGSVAPLCQVSDIPGNASRPNRSFSPRDSPRHRARSVHPSRPQAPSDLDASPAPPSHTHTNSARPHTQPDRAATTARDRSCTRDAGRGSRSARTHPGCSRRSRSWNLHGSARPVPSSLRWPTPRRRRRSRRPG